MPRERMGGNSRQRVRLNARDDNTTKSVPVLKYKGGGHYDILVGGEVVAKAQGLEEAQEAAREAVS